MGKEGKLQDRIFDYCKSLTGCFAFKIPHSPFGRRGLPDVCIIFHGEVWFMELKSPDGKLEDIQLHRVRQIQGAGGNAAVVESLEEVKKILGTDVERPAPYVIGRREDDIIG